MTNASPPVTLASTVVRSPDVLMQEVGGEAVLLDLASEQYFGLDLIGTRIWALLGETGTLETVHARLCAKYDAPPERIATDLLALMQALVDAGLVQIA